MQGRDHLNLEFLLVFFLWGKLSLQINPYRLNVNSDVPFVTTKTKMNLFQPLS